MANISFREAVSRSLKEALDEDDRAFIMGQDIGAYGGSYAVTRGFLARYGEERVRDTPIAESVMVGAGVGAALGGLRPIVEIMTINFSLLAMDQIINHAAKLRYMSGGQLKVPLIIRTVTGGGAGLGATHSQCFEYMYASIPGLKVVVPCTPYDALGLFRTAIKDDNSILFAEHALLYGTKGEVPEKHYAIPFGVADIKRKGRDITFVSYGRMVHVALAAAEELAEKGVEAEVVDLRTLRPWDVETVVKSVKKTGKAVVVEETWRTGGFGAEVASQVQEEAFDHLDAPISRVGAEEVPMPFAVSLERAVIPSKEKLLKVVAEVLGIKAGINAA